MFKTVLTAVLGIVALTANAQNTYTLQGKVSPANDGKKVTVSYAGGGKVNRDSAFVKDGVFIITGKIGDPVKARMVMVDPNGPAQPRTMQEMYARDEQDIYLEATTIKVEGESVRTAKVTGGPTQSDQLRLQAKLKPFQDEMQPIQQQMMKLYQENKRQEAQALSPQIGPIRVKMEAAQQEFMAQNPDSFVTLDMLNERAAVIDERKIGPVYEKLSPRLKATARGKYLGERLAAARKIGIGKPAVEFVQNDTDGKPLSLASLKGKYVLVDFWASWCGPCRQENPNVVVAYNKFKDKNFEIVGVSLDTNKELWLKAIKDDKLPWLHVSDLKGWQNEVAALYDVKAVPQNFLIAPDGTIIAKDLRGAELEQQLLKALAK